MLRAEIKGTFLLFGRLFHEVGEEIFWEKDRGIEGFGCSGVCGFIIDKKNLILDNKNKLLGMVRYIKIISKEKSLER